MDNYSLLKKNGKYAIMKDGNKRALRLFKTEEEALKYAEENDLNLHRDDHSPEVVSEVTPSGAIDEPMEYKICNGVDCNCKKPSLLSRIIGLFKRTN
jgi:hypothetical protein